MENNPIFPDLFLYFQRKLEEEITTFSICNPNAILPTIDGWVPEISIKAIQFWSGYGLIKNHLTELNIEEQMYNLAKLYHLIGVPPFYLENDTEVVKSHLGLIIKLRAARILFDDVLKDPTILRFYKEAVNV